MSNNCYIKYIASVDEVKMLNELLVAVVAF